MFLDAWTTLPPGGIPFSRDVYLLFVRTDPTIGSTVRIHRSNPPFESKDASSHRFLRLGKVTTDLRAKSLDEFSGALDLK
jgi:hypothetical protein